MTCPIRIKGLIKNLTATSGFTIIEVLIVILIIGIVAGTTLPSFGTHNKRQNLKLQAKKLKTDIRTVQSRSVSGFKNKGVPSPGDADAAAWGVRIVKDLGTYQVFSCKSSDTFSDYKYDGDPGPGVDRCDNFHEEEKIFQSRVSVTDITFDPVQPDTIVNIIFDVITGEVFILKDNGTKINDPAGVNDVIVTLNYPGWVAEEVRRVRVTSGGNIEDYYGP